MKQKNYEGFMKSDKQLVTLCKRFAELEEPEKDYILGISRALLRLLSVRDSGAQKINDNLDTHILHTYKGYLA